jgi:hypothetical protein
MRKSPSGGQYCPRFCSRNDRAPCRCPARAAANRRLRARLRGEHVEWCSRSEKYLGGRDRDLEHPDQQCALRSSAEVALGGAWRCDTIRKPRRIRTAISPGNGEMGRSHQVRRDQGRLASRSCLRPVSPCPESVAAFRAQTAPRSRLGGWTAPVRPTIGPWRQARAGSRGRRTARCPVP